MIVCNHTDTTEVLLYKYDTGGRNYQKSLK